MCTREELLKSEVQLADDECCIVFDFGCYFPYLNFDALTFEFSFGPEEFDDYKINRRYPNRCWQTISKKYGRRVSKVGYPYVMKLNEQELMFLRIKVGIQEFCYTRVFPVQTCMTKDKPVCGLTLRYMFDSHSFSFTSHGKAEEGDWIRTRAWGNCELNFGDEDIQLSRPHKEGKYGNAFVYDNVIEPYPVALSDLFL